MKSVEYYTELVNMISVRKANLALDVIKEEIISISQKNQQAFGYNHFRYIFEIALVESPIFMADF